MIASQISNEISELKTNCYSFKSALNFNVSLNFPVKNRISLPFYCLGDLGRRWTNELKYLAIWQHGTVSLWCLPLPNRVSISILSRFLPFRPDKIIMAFGDLKTENGVKALNEFLADRSYIEG
jgi:hypothetical protein